MNLLFFGIDYGSFKAAVDQNLAAFEAAATTELSSMAMEWCCIFR
jgi:hypothetical protein